MEGNVKYAVQTNLTFDTPAKRDQMLQAIKNQIAGKLTWGLVVVAAGNDKLGKPNNMVEIRFDTEADMNKLFALIKDKMEQLPVLKGLLSKHLCPHDEMPKPCIISEEFEKV